MVPVVFKWLARQISLVGEIDKLRDEVGELREDCRAFREDLIRHQASTSAALAKETAEREKFMLQVQNLLLQWERRLPPPGGKPPAKRTKRIKRGG